MQDAEVTFEKGESWEKIVVNESHEWMNPVPCHFSDLSIQQIEETD